MNYGDGSNYTAYSELSSGINDFSIKFSLTSANGSNNLPDGNTINIIIAVTVPLGVIAIAGGVTFYFYRKNPEQFKEKFRRLKEKIKEKTPKRE